MAPGYGHSHLAQNFVKTKNIQVAFETKNKWSEIKNIFNFGFNFLIIGRTFSRLFFMMESCQEIGSACFYFSVKIENFNIRFLRQAAQAQSPGSELRHLKNLSRAKRLQATAKHFLGSGRPSCHLFLFDVAFTWVLFTRAVAQFVLFLSDALCYQTSNLSAFIKTEHLHFVKVGYYNPTQSFHLSLKVGTSVDF